MTFFLAFELGFIFFTEFLRIFRHDEKALDSRSCSSVLLLLHHRQLTLEDDDRSGPGFPVDCTKLIFSLWWIEISNQRHQYNCKGGLVTCYGYEISSLNEVIERSSLRVTWAQKDDFSILNQSVPQSALHSAARNSIVEVKNNTKGIESFILSRNRWQSVYDHRDE